MASEVIVKADKIKKRNNIFKILKLGLTILFVVLIFAFIILSVVYKGGKFTISLDSRLANDSKIVIYEDNVIKEGQRKLSARDIEFMDNISIDWIPKDIDNYNGSHNGENYIAYTFYIENEGKEIINYWYSIIIDDVIKNVDEASRVMIYLNGEKTIYAKLNSYTGKEETDTKAFFDKKTAVLEQRKDFSPGMIDKFTIVIWLEGDDPDCTDNLLGGEIKMHMEIRGEYKDGEE
ncbi:MAG: hypothetical protein PUD07_05845 [bacterium]|nr:hypothetical protein [bacterium]